MPSSSINYIESLLVGWGKKIAAKDHDIKKNNGVFHWLILDAIFYLKTSRVNVLKIQICVRKVKKKTEKYRALADIISLGIQLKII